MKPLYYLATCYRKHPGGLEAAYVMACENTALLMKAGIDGFCPISHGHGPSIHGNMNKTDHALWMRIDKAFLQRCDGLIVLMSENWQLSDGIAEEITYMKSVGKPIIFMNPGTIPTELLRAA